MSANFKKVWYVSCVECGVRAPLIDGNARKPQVEEILFVSGWRFPKGRPLCRKHSRETKRDES